MKSRGCLGALSVLVIVLFTCHFADAFDPLDPNGNITVKWDITAWTSDGYVATVTMLNWQMYRHIESPGWKLSWTWAKKEIIWTMLGAQTTFQGDCSSYHTDPLPHCCDRKPVVVDLLPTASQNLQVANCCRGGVLASYGQDPANALSVFQVTVGDSGNKNTTVVLPANFTLLTPSGPGYTCSKAVKVKNSLFPSADGRRFTEAFMTWNVTCSYEQAIAQQAPTCCVSFSAFYNETIVPCPECACACPTNVTSSLLTSADTTQQNVCVNPNLPYDQTPALSTGGSAAPPPPPSSPDLLYCTQDMCPVKVHWHVKANYQGYWRAKVTVTNRDFSKNFTNWNVVLQHPNFDNLTEAFSFKYLPLNPYGTYTNDSAMFWGVKYYNDLLMSAGPDGNVQSDILFRKGADFTFNGGWAFPSRIYFNGDICAMPAFQDYPQLPSSSPPSRGGPSLLLVLLVAAASSLAFS